MSGFFRSGFFRDGSGNRSMSRLLSFLSFWPASAVLLAMPSEGALGLYLAAYVGGYLGGKALETRPKGVKNDTA